MNRSESIGELATALAKFQGEVSNPSNTATNPFFSSKYAPLDTVLNTVRPILSKHGLSVVQAPSGDGSNIVITTTLLHESGQWMEFPELVLKADKPTAQGAGSSITYGRRYALSAILGISSEDDDDGNSAEPKESPKTGDPNGGKKQCTDGKAPQEANLASEKQLEFIYKLVRDKNYGNESISKYIKSMYEKNNSKELTKQEASELIEMLSGL